jgi:TP901 family phage tail tape measure protein
MSVIAEEYISLFGADTSGYEKGAQRMRDALGRFVDDTDKASNSIGGFVSKISSSFGGIGGSIASFGATVTGALSEITALGSAALAASSDVNKAFREIRVNTGATGEGLSALKKDFANVFGTVPASAADAGFAISKLNQLLGSTGPTLDALATQELNLARITGGDLKGQIDATAKAFNNWKVSTDAQGPALDTLFKISQLTGTSVTALAQQVTSGGAAARAAGLSFETTALLMGQLNKVGIDGGTIMQGFAKAFKTIATKDPNADPAAVLQDVITKIQAAGSAAQANKIAFEVFGRSGLQMADAIKSGRLNLEDLTKALANSKDTINGVAKDTQTFGEAMTVLKNQVELAIAPLGKEMTGVLKSLMPDLQALINIVTQISNAFSSLPNSTKTVVAEFVLLAGSIGPVIIGIGGMVALLGGPLTIALAAVAAAAVVLTADWVTSFGKAESGTASFQDGIITLAKVVGTVMDVVGVFANLQMIAWQTVIGAVTAGVHYIQAGVDALKGNFSGAAAEMHAGAQSIVDSQRGIAQAWQNVTDEMGGKWSQTLQGMVNTAYASVGSFASAGRAGANAYSAAFLNINPFKDNATFGIKAPSQAQINKTILEGLGPPSAAAGGVAGTGAADAFLKSFGSKAKGGGLGKSIVDAFSEGAAGLDLAIAKITPNASKLASLMDPVTKQFKLQGQELEKALSAVAKNINDFLSSAGIKAKVTVADLALNWGSFTGVLSKTEAFERVKDALNAINIQRVAAGLQDFDASLKTNKDNVILSADALQALQAQFPEIETAAKKAGLALTTELPKGIETGKLVAQALQYLSQQNKEFLSDIAFDTKEQLAKAKFAWDDLIRGLPIEVLKQKLADLKQALDIDPDLSFAKAQLEIRGSVESAIETFEKYGETLGMTGEKLQSWAVEQVRNMGVFKEGNQTVLSDVIEKHKLAAVQLPSIWGPVFDKLGSQAKSWAASIFGVLDTIPGAFGKTVKRVTDTISQWAAFFNQILGLLSKFSSSIPSSIGDAITKIVGIFKSSSSAIGGSLLDWTKGLDQSKGKTINATNIMGQATSKMSDGMKTAFGIAGSAAAGFASSLAISANSSSKTMGFLSATISSTLAGIAAGFAFGPVAGAITAGVSLIGGIIGLFQGKSAAQKEQERLNNEKLKADIAASAQATVNAAIQGYQQALVFFESLAQFTPPLKAQFQLFWKNMSRLMDGFVELAKKWQGENLDKDKAIAEAIGAVANGLAATPAAFEAINNSFTIDDTQFNVFFGNLDRFMNRFFERSEVWVVGISKRAQKVADRLKSVADLITPFTEGIKGIIGLQEPTDDDLNVWDRVLEKIVTHIGNLADKFDKAYLKVMQNFADKAQSALSIWKDATDAIRATVDVPVVSESSIDNVVNSITSFVNKLVAAAADMTTEGLAKASAIANSILPIAAAIKAWSEAALLIQGYTGTTEETFTKIITDFHRAISLMTLMLNEAILFIPDAIKFEDTMKTIADHLKAGLDLLGGGLAAAASAFGGVVNAIQGGVPIGSNPAGGGVLGGEGNGFASQSFGSLSLASSGAASSGGNSGSSATVHIHFHGTVIQDRDFENKVINAVVTANRKFRTV